MDFFFFAYKQLAMWGFPGSSVGKESACTAGDPCSTSGLGRSLVEGNTNPLQYSCLENPMDKGTWQDTVHGVPRVRYNLVTKSPPPKKKKTVRDNNTQTSNSVTVTVYKIQ